MSRRKNTFPIVILTVLLWLGFGFLIIFVDPTLVRDLVLPNTYLVFFLILYCASFLTIGLIAKNSLIGLLWSTGLLLFLILRLLKLGYWLNLVLIIGVCITLQITFTKKD